MDPIVSNPTLYFPTCRATAAKQLREKIAGLHPHQPAVTYVTDFALDSSSYLQEIPVDPSNFVTSTLNGNGPVVVAGRVCECKALLAAELVTSKSHTYSTAAEVEQEQARQSARKIAADAEDLRIGKGKQIPFTVQLPGVGTK